MAKVKYDVTGVEDAADWVQAPVGLYRAQIAETTTGASSAGQPMLTIVLELTHDGKGKKLKEKYGRIWHRVPLEHWEDTAGWTFRLKEFIKALGLKEKGSFDPDKLEGDKLQVKLRAGKDLDDNYRPEVSKLMALASDDDADEEEPEEDEEDEQDEEEEEDEQIDLESMSLADLKELAEEEEVEVEGKATKKKLIAALEEHYGAGEDEEEEDEEQDEEDEDTEDEEETEEEEDEEEDDDEAEDYSDWSRNALIKEARSREIKVTKKMSDDDIREALVESDGEEDEEEEEEQDYSDWSVKDLKAELKERGLKTTGSQSQLIKRLESDDESEEDPF